MGVEYMFLANPTNQPIAFKVKTTASNQYQVKPVTGIVSPGNSKTITVVMQPLNNTENILGLNNHKFMVEWAFVADEHATNVANLVSRDPV